MTTPEDFSNERFSDYLRSLCDSDAPWWKTYAFMDEIDDATWFEFELDSKTQDQPKQTEEKPGEKTLPVLQAVEDYAHEKILIVGSPGAGKSTLLTRLLWQAAQKAQQSAKAPIPILVELKLCSEAGIWELIQTSLENCNLYLEVSDIKKLVEHRRLLLLADGFNELPNDHARTKFKKFCGRRIPVIVTSRDGTDDLGLERKLQIQPLTNAKVKAFLQSRLPGYAQAQIKELSDRVKDFGQTPLMVWMLFSIFRQNGDIPTTRGEAYRAFTMLYAERAKEGIDLDESRGLLSKLAFELMHAEKPTDFRPDIGEVDAQNLLGSEKALKQLVRNHLLQVKGKLENRRISFCHQSLQEYYAAEALLVMLQNEHPDVMDDKRLQYFYLNYLKWTEPISIALSLLEIEDEIQILRLVELALDIDWILGARLAGVVKPRFQQQTVIMVSALDVPGWLKVQLLGETLSKSAAPELLKLLEGDDISIYKDIIFSTLRIDKKLAAPKIAPAISKIIACTEPEYFDEDFRSWASGILSVAIRLGIPIEEHEISSLLKTLNSKPTHIEILGAFLTGDIETPQQQWLGKPISELIQSLKSKKKVVRDAATYHLSSRGSGEHLNILRKLQLEIKTSWEYCSTISKIQVRCQFYNYEIAQWKLAPHTTERSSSITIQGDYIAGDKIEGDKNIIDRVGNLNQGNVNILGNQNGETPNL
ncbi:MAG: NACHT domain-containing protein [Candidatus Parcubacteria bacterium]|nr:NACHT domain-containing protein [Leptolyngbyaceae cyanobacterium LF-bin-113]